MGTDSSNGDEKTGRHSDQAMANYEIKRRKRKTVIIHESSSSDDEQTPLKESKASSEHGSARQKTPRSSERLQKKRCREFHKPSREDIWKKITPTKSPGKYEELRPKRLVNNYTKENNRYNYDPNETSGSESMDDFIDDSITDESSSDDSTERSKHIKQIRIKGRHRRLQTKEESDDSNTSDDDRGIKDQNKISDIVSEKCDDNLSGDSAVYVETNAETSKDRLDKLNAESDNGNSTEHDTDEETEDITAKSRKHNRSIIESDVERTSESDSKEDIVMKRKHNRSIIESDDDNSNDAHLKAKNIEGNGSGSEHAEEKEELSGVKIEETNVNGKDHDKDDSKSIKKPDKNGLLPNTSKNVTTANTSARDSETIVIDDSAGTCDSERVSDGTDDDEDDDEEENDTDMEESDNEEVINNTGRVRVQMMKRKKERKKLFDQFRKERQRRLSKEH